MTVPHRVDVKNQNNTSAAESASGSVPVCVRTKSNFDIHPLHFVTVDAFLRTVSLLTTLYTAKIKEVLASSVTFEEKTRKRHEKLLHWCEYFHQRQEVL